MNPIPLNVIYFRFNGANKEPVSENPFNDTEAIILHEAPRNIFYLVINQKTRVVIERIIFDGDFRNSCEPEERLLSQVKKGTYLRFSFECNTTRGQKDNFIYAEVTKVH